MRLGLRFLQLSAFLLFAPRYPWRRASQKGQFQVLLATSAATAAATTTTTRTADEQDNCNKLQYFVCVNLPLHLVRRRLLRLNPLSPLTQMPAIGLMLERKGWPNTEVRANAEAKAVRNVRRSQIEGKWTSESVVSNRKSDNTEAN